ncbi:hypothetical protein HDF17_003627 [Granulicella arctica]|uniref:Uncharacterized protein n=1 Tax=Granulicella arctica TaxID=940613 RepID=A0A7Y9PJY7_9BACT|nr:hypothetical protein [Granulicella arctica]
MTRLTRVASVGFIVGALVPLFWGVLSFLLFNLPEGWLSRAYWRAVYITCPFWLIEGQKAMFLMPILNGCMYALLAVLLLKLRGPALATK